MVKCLPLFKLLTQNFMHIVVWVNFTLKTYCGVKVQGVIIFQKQLVYKIILTWKVEAQNILLHKVQ